MENQEAKSSYNFVMGVNWMLVVMRKKDKAFDVVSLNSMGVLGSVFTKNEKVSSFIKKKKPKEIFEEILVKERDNTIYKMKM